MKRDKIILVLLVLCCVISILCIPTGLLLGIFFNDWYTLLMLIFIPLPFFYLIYDEFFSFEKENTIQQNIDLTIKEQLKKKAVDYLTQRFKNMIK